MTVPVPPENLLVILLASFSIFVIAAEVFRRNPRLAAAQLMFMGALIFQVWSCLEIVLEVNSDDPARSFGIDIAIQPILTFLACLLLHLTFLFPLHLGLKNWLAPLVYLPFLASATFRSWVILTWLGGTPVEPEVLAAFELEPTAVNLIPVGLAMLNLARAHRRTDSLVIRGRIRAIAVGVAATLVLGTSLTFSTLFLGRAAIPTTLAALPVLFALAYSILRYQLFDIQLLKREMAIVGVGALVTAAIAAPVVYLSVTVSRPDALQLAALLGAFAFTLFAAGARIRGLATALVERGFPWLKWRECQLRALFLVHQSGTLVAEQQFPASNVSGGAADRKGFVGEMLVVVQALARESLGMQGGDTIRSFNIGSRKVMVEHSGEMFLMAEFDGFEHPEIRGEVARVLRAIVRKMDSSGLKWEGDVGRFSWAELMLAEIGLGRRAQVLSV